MDSRETIHKRLQLQLEQRRREFALDKKRAASLYQEIERKRELKQLELEVVTAEAAVSRAQKLLNRAEQDRLKLEIALLEQKEEIVREQQNLQQAQLHLSKKRKALNDFFEKGNKKDEEVDDVDVEENKENLSSETLSISDSKGYSETPSLPESNSEAVVDCL